jgi:hypothetical protein
MSIPPVNRDLTLVTQIPGIDALDNTEKRNEALRIVKRLVTEDFKSSTCRDLKCQVSFEKEVPYVLEGFEHTECIAILDEDYRADSIVFTMPTIRVQMTVTSFTDTRSNVSDVNAAKIRESLQQTFGLDFVGIQFQILTKTECFTSEFDRLYSPTLVYLPTEDNWYSYNCGGKASLSVYHAL